MGLNLDKSESVRILNRYSLKSVLLFVIEYKGLGIRTET